MNFYPENISKEQIQDLPIGRFEGDIQIVNKTSEIDNAINYLRKYEQRGRGKRSKDLKKIEGYIWKMISSYEG